MQQTKEKRTAVLPVIRVSPNEKEAIKNAFLNSPYANQSAFIRSRLLQDPRLNDAEKRLQEELLFGEIYTAIEKIEGQIQQIVAEKKRTQGDQIDRLVLLPFAKVIQWTKKIKELITQNDPI